jgi:excisionase family DNA binding protein
MVEYITIQEAAEKWGITSRRIQVLCAQGRLEGAVKFGRQWAIPAKLKKPEDARIKNGKYMKEGNQNKKII